MSSILTKIAALFHSAEHYAVALGKTEVKVAMASPLGQAISGAIKAGEVAPRRPRSWSLALSPCCRRSKPTSPIRPRWRAISRRSARP